MISAIEYFNQGSLALASYADLSGTTSTYSIVLQAAGMSKAQANQFLINWSVLDQFTDASGASATVFQARDAQGNPVGPKYLAIRGTEASGSDLAADGILALGIPSGLNPQFAALKTQIDKWKDNGTLSGSFTVSGHSLGGYLAAAVKQRYGTQVTDAYLFNAPGVGGLFGNLADALTGALGLSGTPSGNIWNVRASEGFPFISGLGSQLGTRIDIQTEAAANALNNHSIVTLTDALAIQAAYVKLAPALTQVDLNALIDASGNPMSLTFEAALDALRTVFAGPALTPTQENRDTFYANLYDLQKHPAYIALAAAGAQITVLAGKTNEVIAGLAKQDSATGLAIRYALKALNPFALVGANYTAFTAKGALDRYNTEAGTGDFTDNYLADRANFLERKLWFSTEDKNPVNPQMTVETATNLFEADDTYFADSASGYTIAQGRIIEPTRRYLFGDETGNILTGGSVGDSLYGGSGNDTLQGKAGPDWIEGGRDNDIFVGGTGDDVLLGGQGLDSYVWNTGDGDDRLMDADCKGRIVINGQGIKALLKQDDGTWKTPDGKVTLAQAAGRWKLNIEGGGSLDLGTIFNDGDYGLCRLEAPVLISRTKGGDLKPILDGNNNLQFDALDNVIVNPGIAQDNRADTLYGSTGNDRIQGLGGDDALLGQSGNDILEGGSGSDVVKGGAGNDLVLGDGYTTVEVAYAAGKTDSSSTAQGNWLDGGDGNDVLLGGAAQDALSGGADADLLIGGAGDDLLLGDATLTSTRTDWSVNNVAWRKTA